MKNLHVRISDELNKAIELYRIDNSLTKKDSVIKILEKSPELSKYLLDTRTRR